MAVNKDGKYTKLTDDTIRLLEEAFAIDCPITEACLFADISTPTYYAWIKDNPELEKRFNELRERPFLKARKTIMKGIGENYNNAMDYMKRKKKKEFGDNIDLTSKGEKVIPIYGGQSNVSRHESDKENISITKKD